MCVCVFFCELGLKTTRVYSYYSTVRYTNMGERSAVPAAAAAEHGGKILLCSAVLDLLLLFWYRGVSVTVLLFLSCR